MIDLTGAPTQFINLTHVQQLLGSTRTHKTIERLSGHVIVCGFGRTGSMLARELKAGRSTFVVVEPDAGRIAEVRALGYLYLPADVIGLEIEMAVAQQGSAFAGLTAEEIEECAERRYFIVAIEPAGGRRAARPLPGARIEAGDGVTLLRRADRARILANFSVAAG